MADTLAAQERLRKQLVSNAAHELRTPLMVIRGELEGMIDGLLPTTPEALQSLHDEAARLAAILDGVDELTRAQASSLTLNLQPTRLVPFFQQIVSRFATQAAEQQIRITVEGDPTLTARIDRDQFTRIIINLATNAFRAMPQGGQFDLLVTKTNAHSVYIDIMDTGCGIEPDQLPHIFERFYKGKNGGLGLGLAIVKELIDAHNGTISVQSESGKGTCFLLELPESNGGDTQ
jgi:two-component system sensor histidine kinase BaeS